MGIVLTNPVKRILLALELPYFRTLTIHLYQNDLTPTGETVLGDFEESTFAGYAPQSLPDWSPTYTNSLQRGETDYPLLVWSLTGPPFQAIYGYYVTHPTDGLVWSERNPNAPFYINISRRRFSLLLRVQLDTLI